MTTVPYYGDATVSYKPVTYSDASIIICLFRTDGEVAVFVRESASIVTGKTDKWTLSRGFVCLDRLSRVTEKKDPETELIVRLRMNTNAKPSLSSIHTLQAESGLNDYETGETSWKQNTAQWTAVSLVHL